MTPLPADAKGVVSLLKPPKIPSLVVVFLNPTKMLTTEVKFSAICLVSPGKTVVIDHPEKTVPYCIAAECELNGCDYNVGKVCAGSVCFFHGTQYNSGKSGFFVVLTDDSRTVRMVEGAYALFGQVLEGLQMADMLSRTGNDEHGVPRVYHRIKSVRVETHGRQFPFETCPEPESTIGKVILNKETDADLSSGMQA